MGCKADQIVSDARMVADRLEAEGRAFDADKVRRLIRSNTSLIATCASLGAEVRKLRGESK